MLLFEVVLVVVLILVNGFLAMSELAIVSSRRSRLQALANAGRPGAAAALALSQRPGRFLSTVQIGITLVGVLASVFGGATLADDLAAWLTGSGLSSAAAETSAFFLVVAGITYLSVVVGELVPKQIALSAADGVAARVAPTMAGLARLASPVVWLLERSSALVLNLLGARSVPEATVTEEEIRALIAEGETAGVVEPAEKRMLASVLRLGDRPVRAVMTPRPEVAWIDLEDDAGDIRQTLLDTPHTRLPASRGGIDEVVGVIRAKDLLDAYLSEGTATVAAHVREAPVVHDGADVLQVIEVLKKSPVHMALVVDEYGAFQGVVTPADVLEAIVGSFEGTDSGDGPPAVQRDDGSWLLDGAMPVDDLGDLLEIAFDPDRDFHTLAGFVLASLKHLPTVGEAFDAHGWRFEVVDMDGRRIDKILAARTVVLHRR